MDIPFHKLEGASVAGWTLRARVERDAGPPYTFSITAERGRERCTPLAGRTNPGTSWRWPWFEARLRPCVGEGDERHGLPGSMQEDFFRLVGTIMPPGSYIMLSLDGHSDSARALTMGVPPACSPIGHLLWVAGCRWFKLWYYPEGWMEGNEKLQGNVPPNARHRDRAEAARRHELAEFLVGPLGEEFPGCAALARHILDPNTASRTA